MITNPQLIQQKEFAIFWSPINDLHFWNAILPYDTSMHCKNFCCIKLTKKRNLESKKTGSEKLMLSPVKEMVGPKFMVLNGDHDTTYRILTCTCTTNPISTGNSQLLNGTNIL